MKQKTLRPPGVKANIYTGKGALDLDGSLFITRDIENDSPTPLQRQTTPSEWLSSPERFHTPSSSPEPAEECPVSPSSTPPLFTPEQPQETQEQEEVIAELIETSQAFSATAEEAPTNDSEVTSPKPPTPAQRRRSLPPFSSASAYSSSLSNSRTKATSLPSNVFHSSASNTRRDPLPSVKISKEACGEILVPSSDSGDLVIRPSSHQSSPPGLATVAAFPERVMASPSVSPSPERIIDSYDAQSSIPEPQCSQDPNDAPLDELSRMALNGSYPLPANNAQTSNEDVAREEEAAMSPSPVAVPDPEPSYSTLPPSSVPIHSQTPSWQDSAVYVEETVAVEGTSYHSTQDMKTKRSRPSLSPSPGAPQSKRLKLMLRDSIAPDRQRREAAPQGRFDAELLELGIEVDLSNFDDNTPPFPWGEGLAKLNLRQAQHPMVITNSRLAEIWKSVCRSRGWCE